MSTANQRNKAAAAAYWAAVDCARDLSAMQAVAEQHLAPDVRWQGFAPVGDCSGPDALARDYLAPLAGAFDGAFDGLVRDTHILMGGESSGRADGGPDGAMWVGATGYLCGTQRHDLWDIPARGTPLRLRWGEFLEFDAQGRIIRIQTIIDVIDWLEQIGLSPLPPSRGTPFVYPSPTGLNGVLHAPQDSAYSDDTLAFARRFIFDGLNAYDQDDLGSMDMAGFFHPNLKWYGPGGIGACLSFADFQTLHQAPYLRAFPDRQVQDLDNLIAEGDFVGASSLPGVIMTHSGPYLGHQPSGAQVGVNGIDFWRREGTQFTENWVFVDMLHLFGQFGIDLMARVRHMAGADL